MPGFRRWGKAKVQSNPEPAFQILAAVLVLTLYVLFKEFQNTADSKPLGQPTYDGQVQNATWNDGAGKADERKAEKVREAMRHTFWRYYEYAWGCDDILPVSGGNSSSRNGWGAFIVDSASTLALMELWDELAHSVEHILSIHFTVTRDLVDPFETTIRYLGGLVSLIDLYDAGLIPDDVLTEDARDVILDQAIALADKLGPAYDSPTGMPFPRVDFNLSKGVPDPPSMYKNNPGKPQYENPVIGPARAGSSILENRVLTRLTGDPIYAANSTKAWAPLVWSKWITPLEGMVDAPIDIVTGAPVARERHWDGGHDSYYEYLVKMTLLAPPSDPYLSDYQERFLQAASSLRNSLASRSAPAPEHPMQHLFIGRENDMEYQNRQGHLACFAAGSLLLGSKLYSNPALQTFALALLEGCHHTYEATPSKIGPENWSWIPKFGYGDPKYTPQSERQKKEWANSGFWSTDTTYKGRPEYVESLFYAWRITGQQRYRDWAWEAFTAIEQHTKAPYGYAQLRDVYRVKPEEWSGNGEERWIDMQESFWAGETLKYLFLTFSEAEHVSLDQWVFSTEGHPFRVMR